jgi:hypothetical protein
VPKRDGSENALWLSNQGTYELIPADVAYHPVLIDFGHADMRRIHRKRGLGTLRFNCPIELLNIDMYYNSAGRDRYSMARIIMLAANRGVDPFSTDQGLEVRCPPDLRLDLWYANEHKASADKPDKQVLTELVYQYLVLTYTKDGRAIKDLIKVCRKLEGFDVKMQQNETFLLHVQQFSLEYGEYTKTIRRCPIFKSKEHALFGFSRMMHPIPDARMPPEVFATMLRDRSALFAPNEFETSWEDFFTAAASPRKRKRSD